ncbi:MAG: hypothetical protein CSA55_03040 [Ilumatobacter coccineus]|uniref:Histone deacetylase domain-containing protein n=1 Tax=Ilumatobacter coccineus TaxID=467094 RepID=A0A2G6KBJ6_9ACTN|nr:MAG: hypothetical protein CSA55_03040 [Ilumatobacter coccineus]
MSSPLIVFAAEEFDDHRTPEWHPENRHRLDAALLAIGEADLADATEWHIPELAPIADLASIHDPAYLTKLEELCLAGGGHLDEDTVASPGSWITARRAAGAVLDAIDALRAGECDLAFAAGRPPGHHAVPAGAMGFCLFNNAAVGAARLSAAGEKVVIVDWDVHHGNGTQDIFYDDPNVLYISTHESPLYPFTGLTQEQGVGDAFGTTMNLPFPAGTAGDTFRAAFDEVIVPTIERFQPDWMLISAGFDAHRSEPLASLDLTSADYADLALRLQPLVPPQRLVVVLEGGYDMKALTYSTGATLSALLGGSYRPEEISTGTIGRSMVAAAQMVWDL